jgi:hypothetical protein
MRNRDHSTIVAIMRNSDADGNADEHRRLRHSGADWFEYAY